MTDQPLHDADDAGPGLSPEHDHQHGHQHGLEYDLAHEAFDQRCIGPGGTRRRELGQAPVRTDDYDGDYGYDLAHDIPRRRRD